MKTRARTKRPVSAESIAKLAEQGKDITRHFTNDGEMMPPIQQVNVDFTQGVLNELDDVARQLNVSRQAVIKIFVRQALDQHYLAKKARKVS